MDELVRELIQRRNAHCFPLRVQSSARQFANSVLAVLFPHFAETMRCDEEEVAAEVTSIQAQLEALMSSLAGHFLAPPPKPPSSFFIGFPKSTRP